MNCKGSITTTDPITSKIAINSIKLLLEDKPLDLAYFVLGINTNLRASDLLALKTQDLAKMTIKKQKGMVIGKVNIRERKTGKKRVLFFNKACIKQIKKNLNEEKEYFFTGNKKTAWTTATVGKKVKKWCKQVGLTGNYSSHTLRKTWGYFQRTHFNKDIGVLMKCFNHSSEKETLRYIGITTEEQEQVFNNVI